MKLQLIVSVLSSALLFVACGERAKTGPEVSTETDDPDLRLTHENASPMRGYKAINSIVRERIVDDPEFQLVRYLQDYDPIRDFQGGSILPLLGGYMGRGTTMSNQTAIPGSMNMLLWFVIVDGLAADIAKHCTDEEQTISLKASFKEQVKALCQIQEQPEAARTDMERVWEIAVKQDSTELQKELWIGFLSEVRTQEDRNSYVRDAMLTALFSPEFLAGR